VRVKQESKDMQKLNYEDFVGNEAAVKTVRLLTDRAIGDNSCRIPDIAFLGPSGHGKNTLARIVANALDRQFIEINSTVIRDPFQFRSLMVNGDFNSTGVIIHLDECHQLPRKIQDNLLSALEEPRKLHTASKDQVFTDSLVENMSFIFSTTHAGALRKALRSRLEHVEFLEYSMKELLQMAVKYLVRAHGMKREQLDASAVAEIARRARSGRQVVKFCDNIVRYMESINQTTLDRSAIDGTFDILGVDKFGLTRVDRKMLTYLAEYNSYVGLDTLEAVMNMTKKDIRVNLEPFLLQRGFIIRKPAGRLITTKGKKAVVQENK
jgi:Holliday junction DNA helicase RuvB